jgi:uncharacterized coiled-coil DUF342 family protein
LTLSDDEFHAKTTEIRTRLEGMRESDSGADPVQAQINSIRRQIERLETEHGPFLK